MKKILTRTFKLVVAALMVLVMLPYSLTTADAAGTGAYESNVLNDFVMAASFTNISQDGDGTYHVKAGDDYEIKLSFTEEDKDGGKQFADTMTYTFPSGFEVADGTKGTIDVSVDDGTKSYTVTGNPYSVKGNVLTFSFNQSNQEAWNALKAASNAQMSIKIKGVFSENAKTIDWSNSVSTKVTITNPTPTTSSVTVNKGGWYDNTNHVMHYTLDVYSSGTNTNVTVVDTLTGTALTYDKNASDTSKKGSVTTSSDKGFTFVIPSMNNGESDRIEYTASINFNKLTGAGVVNDTVDQTNNHVAVHSHEDTTDDTKDFHTDINYTSIQKSGKESSDAASEAGHKLVSWTVVYNNERQVAMGGRTITDEIVTKDGNTQYLPMTYTGTATILVYKAGDDNNPEERTVINLSGTTFSYHIPETDTEPYKYVITYNTDVDMTGLSEKATVANKVSDGHGNSTKAEANVGPNADSKISVKKTVVSTDKTTTTWNIALSVPTTGLNKAEVVDTLPNTYIDNETVVDAFKSAEVTGLLDELGEHASDPIVDNNKHTVTIIFYKNSDNVEGLNASAAPRTINITLVTTNADKWIVAAAKNESYLVHENNVQFITDVTSPSDQAKAYPPVDYLNKWVENTDNYSGIDDTTKLPYYRYAIDLRGLSDDTITVTDTFNTDLFTVKDAEVEFYKYDWNKKYNNSTVTPTITDNADKTGVTFSFAKTKIPSGAVRARIVYTLEVKDNAAYESLKQLAASNNGSYTVSNNAAYNNLTSSAESKFKYVGLTKKLLEDSSNLWPSDGSKPYATYQIVVNPDAVDMSANNNYLTVTDIMSDTLIIDRDSIQFTPSENSTYVINGTTATFTVPDQTAVTITYRAYVTGTASSLEITNTAKISDSYKADSGSTWAKGTSGEGSASLLSLNIIKYQQGNEKIRLSNVTFGLYNKDGQVKDINNNPATFTTDSNGEVKIVGNNAIGWTLHKGETYYLVEESAPSTYQSTDTQGEPLKYAFTIGDTADVDNHVYRSGDTMEISNMHYGTQTVNKIWNDNGNQDAKRPTSLPLKLTGTVTSGGNTVTVYTKDVTLSPDKDGNWTATVDKLATYYNDLKISYSWSEKPVSGYQSSSSSVADANDKDNVTTTLTNTHETETTTAVAVKNWNDSSNQDNVRPASVTFQLQKTVNGSTVDVDGKTCTLTSENAVKGNKDSWTYTFDNLQKYENGTKIVYSVRETSSDENYSADTDNTDLTVTNTHKPAVKDVTVYKVWDDQGNIEGLRPSSVTLQLQKTVDGKTEDVEGKSYTLTSANADAKNKDQWSYTFEDLPVNENGKTITYSVMETKGDRNYTADSDNSDLTVTNSRTVEKIQVSGTKTWSDQGNEGARPEYIMIYLHANNSIDAVDSKKVTAADGWKYTFDNLQKYAGGEKIKYSVTEDAVTNYTTQAAGMNVTNTYAPGKTSVKVAKKWVDLDNINQSRPESIQVQLYAQYSADKDPVALGDAVTLTAATEDPWTYTWSDLDQTSNGKEIVYTVKEVGTPSGYQNTVEVGNKANTYTLENTRTTGNLVIKKTLAGDKIDNNDRDNLTFEITKPDGTVETVLYSQFTDGVYTLYNAPAGTYKVHEVNPTIKGYDVTVTTKVDNQSVENDSYAVVSANKDTNYEITDDYTKLGTLVIKKTLAGDTINDNDRDNLKFEITKPDGTTETVLYSQFTDGVYSLGYVPAGTYKVHEVNPTIEGYDVNVTTKVNDEDTDNDVNVAVTKGNTTTYEITDDYTKLGTLVIKKSFDGENIDQNDKDNLKFEITKPDGTTETVQYSQFTDGVYSLGYVPAGTYKVHEVNPTIEGYDVTVTTQVNDKDMENDVDASVVKGETTTYAIKDSYKKPTLPSTPDNPTTPERPTTPSTNNRPKTPNTGDQTNAPLAAGVMGLSMLIAGFAIFFKKKYSA